MQKTIAPAGQCFRQNKTKLSGKRQKSSKQIGIKKKKDPDGNLKLVNIFNNLPWPAIHRYGIY